MSGREVARCAVIIPTLNEADEIADLLAHVSDCGFDEIIVCDGGSRDGTVEAANAVAGVTVLRAPVGRGTQMAAGAAVATSDILLFLHADTRLPQGALSQIKKTLAQPGVVAGCFRLQFRERDFRLALSAWVTRFDTGWTTFGDQAYFMTRTALARAGGMPQVPLLEDVILRKRLKAIGRFAKCELSVITSGRRLLARGVWLGQLRNAFILLAFRCGVSPGKLVTLYGRRSPEPVTVTVGAGAENVGAAKDQVASQSIARPPEV